VVVKDVAFIQQDLAADDLVARGDVAREIDAAHEELFAFVGGQREVDLIGIGNHIEGRLRNEIDIAELAVELAHVLQTLAQLAGGEDISRRHAEQWAHQRFRRAEQLNAEEIDFVQVIQAPFLDRDGDVHGLAGLVLFDQRDLEAVSAGVHHLGGLVENLRRVAAHLAAGRRDRDQADDWAERMVGVVEHNPSDLVLVLADMARAIPSLSGAFLSELTRHLQGQSAHFTFANSWIEHRLSEQGQTTERLILAEGQAQAAEPAQRLKSPGCRYPWPIGLLRR